MKLNGSQIVLECLRNHDADTIFGYPGGAIMPLYDELMNQLNYFKHIRTAHEQFAIHAADGFARSTGKVGICFVTSGPGATNTVTGIATAYMDSVPLVVITAQVPLALLGKDSFQEVDITGICESITKQTFLVTKVEDLYETMNNAFEIAKSGRPGPVVVDIPKDILLGLCDYEKKEKSLDKNNRKYNIDQIEKVAKLINESLKPVIYAGGGVKISKSSDLLVRIAKKSDIPVVNTLMGLGVIDRKDKLSLGIVGMHGFPEANIAVMESDLILVVGARFSDRAIGKSSEFAQNAKIVHLDIDETEIGKNLPYYCSIVGDVNNVLTDLIDLVENKKREKWNKKIMSNKLKGNIRKDSFHPKNILNVLEDAIDGNRIVITDVGQHQIWTAQYWKFNKPNEFITSGGLGTMGFGLGAAIGVKVGNPDEKVVLITGDGCFRMNNIELLTIAKYKLPIIIILMNNQTLGMVRQWQKLFSNERYSETCNSQDVDYIKLVSAYGIKAVKTENLDDLKKILSKISKLDEPVLIECNIDKDEGVYPIVPPGKPIDQFILR